MAESDLEEPIEARTLSEAQTRHLDLLEAWGPETAGALAPAAERLRRAVCGLGEWLDDAQERNRAQSIVDYWTAALTGIPGQPFPEMLRLEPFDPDLARAAAERAESILAPYADTALEEGGEMLLCLVRTEAGGRIATRAPVERADLIPADRPPEAAARVAELLDALVTARVVRRVERGTGEEDRFEFAHGSVARAWPRMRELLERHRSDMSTRDRFRAAARLWKDRGRDRGLLLGGSSLEAAGKYAADDPDLTEFVAESRKMADRRRRQLIVALIVGPVIAAAVLVGSNIGSYKWGIGVEDERRIAQTETPNIRETLAEEPAPPPPGSAPQGRVAPGPTGWIWAGNRGTPLLRDVPSGEVADLSAIAPGAAYRVRTDIWLRDGLPNEDYVSAPELGILPTGRLVIVTEEGRTFDRPSGRQYWVRVRVVPRVYIQFANADRARVEPLRVMLRERGFEVPPAERLQSASRLTEIRYFRKEDRQFANQLAGRIAASINRPDGAPIALACRPVAREAPPGQLEIWLDFRNLRFGAPNEIPEIACS